MQALLRCKMRVSSVKRNINPDGKPESEEIQLNAVYGDTEENKQWSKWTPQGVLSITINNPDAIGKVLNGHEYFVDFTPAPPAGKEA